MKRYRTVLSLIMFAAAGSLFLCQEAYAQCNTEENTRFSLENHKTTAKVEGVPVTNVCPNTTIIVK